MTQSVTAPHEKLARAWLWRVVHEDGTALLLIGSDMKPQDAASSLHD